MNALEKELYAKNIHFDDESIETNYPIIFCKSIKRIEKIASKHGYRIFWSEYDECENDYIITLEKENKNEN